MAKVMADLFKRYNLNFSNEIKAVFNILSIY